MEENLSRLVDEIIVSISIKIEVCKFIIIIIVHITTDFYSA